MTFIPITSRYPSRRADQQRRARVEAVEAAALRRAGQVPQVEADVLELQVRADEDERLPVGQLLEQLLALGERGERLDVGRSEVAVQDLEQRERRLGLAGRHGRRAEEDLVVVDRVLPRRGGDRRARDGFEDALELDAAHPLRRLVQHLVELAVHAEHLVQLAGRRVQQSVGPRRSVERAALVGGHAAPTLGRRYGSRCGDPATTLPSTPPRPGDPARRGLRSSWHRRR
ncbi:MAG: hypothetical protein ACXVJF_07655 [Acidimicrobiia bacterium]